MAAREVKLCLLGDSGVGKSSIVLRFVRDQYKENLESTIGASFMTKRIIVDGNSFVFQIWDTAGQEKYRALAPMYYRGASAAIVVYDVTRESSFPGVKDWINELNKNASGNIVIAIAGNKCDLEDLREVDTKKAKDYALDINAIFTETSALTAVNIQQLFETIARKLPAEDIYRPRHLGVSLGQTHKPEEPEQKKRSCCGGGKKS
ncbi:ras-related protein Rab-22A-like [Ruditapes philippinarum]|uniref:ras-related protein Rab-22A-like n=1 Tax=Ruditapes philippinarum TaxID=129788 RepID=UPI00295C1C8F|nr:ras-related protein Rab-22A-like [Ruditapes philippinarum]